MAGGQGAPRVGPGCAVTLQLPVRCSEAGDYLVAVTAISAHIPISDLGQFCLKKPGDMGTRTGGRGQEPGGMGRGLSDLLLVFLLVFDFPLSELGASLPSPSGGTFMLEDPFSRGGDDNFSQTTRRLALGVWKLAFLTSLWT